MSDQVGHDVRRAGHDGGVRCLSRKGTGGIWKKAGTCQPLYFRRDRKPVSVLSCHLSSQPTPWKRAGSPFALAGAPVYLVLQAPVPSPSYVATRRRELLPHGFTLTLAGGLFSVTASIRLLPSVLSTAGRPLLSGLSSDLRSEESVSSKLKSATGHPT